MHRGRFARAIRRGHGGVSTGSPLARFPILFAPETLQVLADSDREITRRSRPRQRPGASDRPPLEGLEGLRLAQPSPRLRGPRDPLRRPRPPASSRAQNHRRSPADRASAHPRRRTPVLDSPIATTKPRPIPPLTVDDLEHRLKDMLAPIVARLLEEVRPRL